MGIGAVVRPETFAAASGVGLGTGTAVGVCSKKTHAVMAITNDAIKMVKNLVEVWKFTRILPESTEMWRGKFYQLTFVLELPWVYHH